MKILKLDNRGVAALLVIIIISASALIMAFSASMLGIGELNMGFTSQKSGETYALADGCTEEALFRLRSDYNWTGQTLSFPDKSCIISVTANGGSRVILVESIFGDYRKKVQTTVSQSGNNLIINSWQEI